MDGSVDSVNIHLTGDLDLQGLTFSVKDLGLEYDKPSDTLYVDGSASVSWGSSSSFQVNLGDGGSKHGLVFQGGNLTALYASISGNVTFASLTLTPNGLGLGYEKASNEFDIFGSAGLSWKSGSGSDNLTISLGTAASPGLTIQGGQLTALNASISGDFSVKNALKVSFRALTFRYDTTGGSQIFDIDGSASVSSGDGKLSSISATLGDGKSNHGVEVKNGAIQSFYASLNGTFGLAGVTLSPVNLTVGYNAGQSSLILAGGLKVDLTSTIAVGASIDPSTPLKINVDTGAVRPDRRLRDPDGGRLQGIPGSARGCRSRKGPGV